MLEKGDKAEARVEESKNQKTREEVESESNAFGPWVLVAQKRKPSRNASKEVRPFRVSFPKPNNSLSPLSGTFSAGLDQNLGIRNPSDVYQGQVRFV